MSSETPLTWARIAALRQELLGFEDGEGNSLDAAVNALCDLALSAQTARQAERERANEVLRIGAMMSNLCFNWSQNTDRFTDKERESMESMQKQWDAAAAAIRSLPPSAPQDEMVRVPSKAARDVIAERVRQIEKEGYAAAHDDSHVDREIARAALAYVAHYIERAWIAEELAKGNAFDSRYEEDGTDNWPWDEGWNPKTPRLDLVRGGALLIAEIERIDRAAHLTETPS